MLFYILILEKTILAKTSKTIYCGNVIRKIILRIQQFINQTITMYQLYYLPNYKLSFIAYKKRAKVIFTTFEQIITLKFITNVTYLVIEWAIWNKKEFVSSPFLKENR